NGGDLDPANNVSIDTTPLSPVTAPDLVILKSDGGLTTAEGEVLAYELTVSNIGSQDASGVTLYETVPPHTTFADSSDPGWHCLSTTPGSTCILSAGPVAAGDAPRSYTFAVELDSSLPTGVDSISNSTSVSDDGSNGDDVDPSNNRATEDTPVVPPGEGSADLKASKIDRVPEPGEYDGGDALVIEYLVLLHNQGDTDALEVLYTPDPDPNTAYIAGSASTSDGEILPLDEPPFFQVRIDAIAPGEEPSITFAV
ncbi:MAG: hypothetical protein GY708_00770, partial [Actinomycetia bacterium]|nr:hypothetical protein [Actinomycetes bacterium]